ncbi:type I methionyl aminopeptidase [Paenibacillus sp. P26]|nr:type I methionyl aminopeptidase [Paenibacillus sp. P26]
MSIDSEEDLLALKRIGHIVATAREEMLRAVRPGITTEELDHIGAVLLQRYGATPAPKKEYGFPGTACISVNHIVAHGIPDSTVLKEGDLVNIDVSAELNGFYADTGATMVVRPHDSALKEKLCGYAASALRQGIAKARAGARLNQIGRAFEREARAGGFTVVKNLTGHGIGRKLHEEPEYIPGYYDPSDNRLLRSGLVLALETFVSTGAEFVEEGSDGWAFVTPDGSLVAQYEHTIVVTKNEPIILTAV